MRRVSTGGRLAVNGIGLATLGVLFVVSLYLCVTAVPLAKGAVNPTSRWDAQMIAKPTNFKVGTSDETSNRYEFVFTDIGGAPWVGPIRVDVLLAPGVTAEEITGFPIWRENCLIENAGAEVVCDLPEVKPYYAILEFKVGVAGSASTLLTTNLEVSGGGAPVFTDSFTNVVSPENALFSILGFESALTNPAGDADQTAGGHPTLLNTVLNAPMETNFNPGQSLPEFAGRGPIRSNKDVVVDLPVGVVGNPTAAPQCPIQVFLAQSSESSDCPPGSQIGTFAISGTTEVFAGKPNSDTIGERNPIFNLRPESGYPAELGFYDKGVSHGILAPATLAHSDQGYVVRVVAAELIGAVAGPYYLQTSFFGNPMAAAGLPGAGKAFLTNPGHCSGRPLLTELHLDLWADPAPVPVDASGVRDFGAANFSDPQWFNADAEAPALSGCGDLQFNPTVSVSTGQAAADSPSGLDFKVSVPQNEDPDGRATPPLRDAVVALPQGLVVDPSVASGLAGCTVTELAPHSTNPGACPPASKLGTATVHTPLIDHQLEGSVYIGTPDCFPCTDADALSGRLLKIYIEIDDPQTGVVVKLPGTTSADPATGQLTATFKDNPQLPFEDLELHLKSGFRAPLTTPPSCGEYTTATDLKPWSAPQSGPDATPQARFNLTSGPNGSACAGLANAPAFEAGTVAPLAGTYSPFVLKVSRENGSQRIAAIEATLPKGLVGKLAGIPYCSNAQIAATSSKSGVAERANPTCPLASEIGTVNVGAGSGTPFYVQGHAYLAGPYEGAPLSVEIVTPAVAGPFDLGTVAVRTALYVDQTTAQIHAVSDPIPSILAGIPLDVRSIALNLNRPKFTLNPTSCNPMAVLGATTSTLGQLANLRSRFQVGGCNGLAFKPKLKLSLKGSTQRGKNPALKAVLTQARGQANIRKVSVVLPRSEFIDNRHINSPCTRVQFNAGAGNGGQCPAKSILGRATAFSPLLDKPLRGPVYFRSNGGERELPDLVASLDGQVHLNVVGFVDSVAKKGSEVSRVRNRFAMVPDAPVSRFVLELKGGKRGLLQNSANLCKVKNVATVKFDAQNGKVHDISPVIANGCGGAKHRKGGR